jgi:hypothetical protein
VTDTREGVVLIVVMEDEGWRMEDGGWRMKDGG